MVGAIRAWLQLVVNAEVALVLQNLADLLRRTMCVGGRRGDNIVAFGRRQANALRPGTGQDRCSTAGRLPASLAAHVALLHSDVRNTRRLYQRPQRTQSVTVLISGRQKLKRVGLSIKPDVHAAGGATADENVPQAAGLPPGAGRAQSGGLRYRAISRAGFDQGGSSLSSVASLCRRSRYTGTRRSQKYIAIEGLNTAMPAESRNTRGGRSRFSRMSRITALGRFAGMKR